MPNFTPLMNISFVVPSSFTSATMNDFATRSSAYCSDVMLAGCMYCKMVASNSVMALSVVNFFSMYRTTSGYDRKRLRDWLPTLCTEAVIGEDLSVVHIRLLSALASVFLTQWDSTHIYAPSWIRSISNASLDVARNPMIKIRSIGSEKCAFMCDLPFLTILAMWLRTVSSYFVDLLTTR